MNPDELKRWRQEQRKALLAGREAVPAATRAGWGRGISRRLFAHFDFLQSANIGIYWPIKSEFDPRFVAHDLREKGAKIALPVVVATGQPLIFREWHPGVAMLKGGLDIPYPASTLELRPDACLIPPVGFDGAGYRLGYGAGFFDRTLAALAPRPLAIGVAFECARIETIHPQPYDIALDFIVTEAAIYAVRAGKLEPIDPAAANALALELASARRLAYAAANAPDAGGFSSPVCHAREFAPGYFGEDEEAESAQPKNRR
jgi:5,10-methenyltetrahydrofolate synthetase